MKIIIFITLIVAASIIYPIIWYPTLMPYKIFFIALLTFLSLCWLAWGFYQIRFRKWYKQSRRFRWYNKMGLLESAYILEPEHTTRYWRNLIGDILK